MLKSTPKITATPLPRDIVAVSSYYNPEHYKSKRRNLELFRSQLDRQSVPYLIVECSFQGAPFELPVDSRILRIRANDVMWQKERLLNIAIQALPDNFTKVIWLDCDLLFEDDLWAAKASLELETYSVIQPYSWSVRLPKGHTSYRDCGHTSPSFAWVSQTLPVSQRTHYNDHGRPGFAWAGRREWLDKIGLYDCCIMGGADHLMAHAFDGHLDAQCLSKFWRDRKMLREHFIRWAESFQTIARRPSLGVVEGRLLHLWHGSTESRYYSSRQKILEEEHFDPATDLRISASGAWMWNSSKSRLHQAAQEYFANRLEDTKLPNHASTSALRRQMKSVTREIIELPIFYDVIAQPRLSNTDDRPRGSVVIYEWHAWSGYMLPRLIPGAVRLEASPTESCFSILKRLPADVAVFAFHLNFSNTSNFPLSRTDLCKALLDKHVRLLNGKLRSIEKRAIHSICRQHALNTVAATLHSGPPSELVIVKTNRNYAGHGERYLTESERFAMSISDECPLETIDDYRVSRRDDVPTPWWTDQSLVIESFKSNAAGIKYRCYFAGTHFVIITTTAPSIVMRQSLNHREETVCTTYARLAAQKTRNVPIDLQATLVTIVREMHLDFGAVDFVCDDAGNTYVIDVNSTTFSRGLSPELLDYLKAGLVLFLNSGMMSVSDSSDAGI